MANNNDSPYEERDDAISANNILMQLCILDREDRDAGRPPAWHDITTLAEYVRGFENRTDVAYIAEERLRGLIERDPQNQNVRLIEEGRQKCHKGIDIPPSSNQARVRL